MFLNFSKMMEQMPVLEKRERELIESGKYFDTVLKAESLEDVKDVPTEDLARVVLGMQEYVNSEEIAKRRLANAFAEAKTCERVRLARLI